MRILVCDDDSVIRYLLNVVLAKRSGDEVIEVADPTAVVSTALETRPDIIVLDYTMPGRSGADLARDLAQQPEVARHPGRLPHGKVGSSLLRAPRARNRRTHREAIRHLDPCRAAEDDVRSGRVTLADQAERFWTIRS